MTLCNFENCRNRGDYGFKTQQPTRCKEHKETNMFSKPTRYCIHNNRKSNCKECDGSGLCTHKIQKQFCKDCGGSQICEHNIYIYICKECCGSGICTHKKLKSRCKVCNGSQLCEHDKLKSQCNKCSTNSNHFCKACRYTRANKKYKGYCVPCYVYTYPEDELSKTAHLKYDELKVKSFIASEFPEIFTYNARIFLGDCDAPYRRFIDFYVMINDTLFAIEVDENQHKGYDQEDEKLRINEILHNIGLDKKMVFIRFNPSAYKIDGKSKRTAFEQRLIKLKETVQEVFDYLEENSEYPDIHTEIKLFFDQ